MNETEKPYRHSKLHGKCVASCNECISEESRNHGIAEGLRMAAEMFRASKWISFKESVPIDGYDFYQSIMAKAKEIEEGKGEK